MALAFAGLSALWLDAPDLQHDVVVVLRPPGRVVAGQWTHVTDSAVVRDWCQPGSICHRYRAVRWHVGGRFRPPWVRLADVAQSAGERFLRTPDAGGFHARLDAFHHDRHGRRGGLWQRGQRGAPGRVDRGFEIGRASCRERVWRWEVDVALPEEQWFVVKYVN